MRLNEQEIKCVELIAHWFETNQCFVSREEAIKQMKVNDDEYDVLMGEMEHIGAIEQVSNVMGIHGYASTFKPSANAIQLAREIEARRQNSENPVDIVEQLKKRARQNPWMAWTIIVFLVLALLVPLINQLWELIIKIFFSK